MELHKKLDDIKNASDDVANLTTVAKNVVREAEENVTVAEQIIEQAGRTLNVSNEILLCLFYFYLYWKGERNSLY